MWDIQTFYKNWGNTVGQSNLKYMGNFNDNHDNARFLSSVVNSGNSSLSASAKLTQFKSLTAFTLTAIGIPMIYYGSEQAFGGGNDPYNREVMWNNFDTTHEMYKFIKTINVARKTTGSASLD